MMCLNTLFQMLQLLLQCLLIFSLQNAWGHESLHQSSLDTRSENSAKHSDVLEYMMELYKILQTSDKMSNKTSSNTVHSFEGEGNCVCISCDYWNNLSLGKRMKTVPLTGLFSFHLTGIMKTEELIRAHLRLKFTLECNDRKHKTKNEDDENPDKCKVKLTISNKCSYTGDKETRTPHIQFTMNVNNYMDDIDVTELLKQPGRQGWIKGSEYKKVCLKISMSDSHHGKRRHMTDKVLLSLFKKHIPVLLLYTLDSDTGMAPPFDVSLVKTFHHVVTRERKKNVHNLKELKTSPCQKLSHYINFKETGWKSEVIAPTGYYANFCYGQCAFPLNSHRSNYSMHTRIQSMLSLVKGGMPSVCCSPIEHSSLVLLYYTDTKNLILKSHSDIVVTKCGCV